jgi:outer membrane lipoprotein carrier protein
MSITLFRYMLVTLFSLLTAAAVQAGEGRTRLDRYFSDFVTLQARFEQTLVDENGKALERSQGTVYLWRPGRFRWDYEAPYEQSIVADGKKVWIYDEDLAQVTVKPLETALGNTPALLLDNRADIDKGFTVVEGGEAGSLVWLALKPKDQETPYATIRLGFDASALRVMELRDNFGQTTRIRFSKEQRNATFKHSLFGFTPPPGVDVLDAAGDS